MFILKPPAFFSTMFPSLFHFTIYFKTPMFIPHIPFSPHHPVCAYPLQWVSADLPACRRLLHCSPPQQAHITHWQRLLCNSHAAVSAGATPQRDSALWLDQKSPPPYLPRTLKKACMVCHQPDVACDALVVPCFRCYIPVAVFSPSFLYHLPIFINSLTHGNCG